MNRTRTAQVLLLLLAYAMAPAIGASDPPAAGAKELFFDPQRSVAEASRPRATSRVTDESGRRVAQVSPEAAVLGLSYWIELVSSAGKPGRPVTDERTFRSGERIRLHFRGNSDGRIVIVQLGTSGSASVLFPDRQKGLAENRVRANHDHVLPSPGHWFRFDDTPGTERLLVLFARTQEELDRTFPTEPIMDAAATAALLRAVHQSSGGKDLLIERETREPSEIGEYAVHLAGKPIAMQIALKHR